jgi:hypothetical protein
MQEMYLLFRNRSITYGHDPKPKEMEKLFESKYKGKKGKGKGIENFRELPM